MINNGGVDTELGTKYTYAKATTRQVGSHGGIFGRNRSLIRVRATFQHDWDVKVFRQAVRRARDIIHNQVIILAITYFFVDVAQVIGI